ncbi:hypothetical protein ARMSODRAFT_1022379 [Armillaria solidipes]|uniref:Uncharacterized protein n=1 Tax=Armillaria solidipes TaxID=1076256 RepID=A0A2H3B8R1_9AGAR|nr:hypothetical protein ARMSODRAFT_1022379 [Armillaria solidipes]
MQITIDFSICTLIALSATILGITGLLTLFLLYRTYKYKIGQFFRRLFSYAPHLPALTFNRPSSLVYFRHPGDAYHPTPYNHLATPSEESYVELPTRPTDGWNTTVADWDTLPSAIFRSRTITNHPVLYASGTVSATSLDSLSHVPDVVRRNDDTSQGMGNDWSSVLTTTTPSPSRRPTISTCPRSTTTTDSIPRQGMGFQA